MDTLLSITRLNKSFGGVRALKDLDLSLEQGEILGIIGPNGAGKTTLFNVVTGFTPCDSGTVHYFGADITRLQVWTITSMGIARTFQNIRLFTNMTVLQNVLVGMHSHLKTLFFGALLNNKNGRELEQKAHARALELVDLVGLNGLMHEIAGNLPYGAQRRVEIARALAGEPKVVLLDEPAAGMNPNEASDLMMTIRHIRDVGHTIAIIEHNLRVVMNVSDRIVVLNFGEKVAEGTPDEVRNDSRVIEAYLGKKRGQRG